MSSIFIGSTMQGLVEERDTLKDVCIRLRHTPVMKDFFGAQHRNSVTVIEEELSKCDCVLLVLVIGIRRGSIVPADHLKLLQHAKVGREVSYTELEYHVAEALGLPYLVYVKEEAGRSPVVSQEENEAVESFVRLVSKVNPCCYHRFRDCKDLGIQSAIDIARHFNEAEWWEHNQGRDAE